MIPERYRREEKFLDLRKKYYKFFLFSALFITGFLVAGPLVHELGHFVVLELHGCNYYSSFSFNIFSGVRGVFNLHCSLERTAQYLFYLSGYGFTLLLGGFSVLYSTMKEDRRVLAAGLGILASLTSSITLEGDLHSVPGLDSPGIVLAGAALGVAALISLYGLEKLVRKEGREQR